MAPVGSLTSAIHESIGSYIERSRRICKGFLGKKLEKCKVDVNLRYWVKEGKVWGNLTIKNCKSFKNEIGSDKYGT